MRLPDCRAGVETPSEIKAEIVRMYEAGALRREITKKLGCGNTTVSAVLKAANVPSRGKKAAAVAAEMIEGVKRLFPTGMSVNEIARELGTTKNAVSGIIYRNKITRSEALNVAARKKSGNGSPRAQARFEAMRAAKQVVAATRPSSANVVELPKPAPRQRLKCSPPLSNPKPWTQRISGECTWPMSGEGADIHSCCAPVSPGTVWCDFHNHQGRQRWSGKGYHADPDSFTYEIARKFA